MLFSSKSALKKPILPQNIKDICIIEKKVVTLPRNKIENKISKT
jgi:hypothetical protein